MTRVPGSPVRATGALPPARMRGAVGNSPRGGGAARDAAEHKAQVNPSAGAPVAAAAAAAPVPHASPRRAAAKSGAAAAAASSAAAAAASSPARPSSPAPQLSAAEQEERDLAMAQELQAQEQQHAKVRRQQEKRDHEASEKLVERERLARHGELSGDEALSGLSSDPDDEMDTNRAKRLEAAAPPAAAPGSAPRKNRKRSADHDDPDYVESKSPAAAGRAALAKQRQANTHARAAADGSARATKSGVAHAAKRVKKGTSPARGPAATTAAAEHVVIPDSDADVEDAEAADPIEDPDSPQAHMTASAARPLPVSPSRHLPDFVVRKPATGSRVSKPTKPAAAAGPALISAPLAPAPRPPAATIAPAVALPVSSIASLSAPQAVVPPPGSAPLPASAPAAAAGAASSGPESLVKAYERASKAGEDARAAEQAQRKQRAEAEREAAAAASAAAAAASAAAKRAPLRLYQMVDAYALNEMLCAVPPTKRACSGYPNCLHGLGYKKKTKGSLWEEHPAHLRSLGADPAALMRSGARANMPAGLKNLGATCYMNTLFQCLFMNKHFRSGLYRFRSRKQQGIKEEDEEQKQQQDADMKDDAAAAVVANGAANGAPAPAQDDDDVQEHHDPDRIVTELQYLFARLEFGRASFEDPCRIVSSLGLKRGEQQDVNEFNNLLLAHLEARLRLTGIPGVTTLVEDEFRGTLEHVLKCTNCGTRSARETSIYDLSLQIAGLRTLEACLLAHVAREVLEGRNKYMCSHCRSLQVAHRTTVIKSLPPVLNIQLLRFAYDPRTDQKKKLNDNVAIPAVLDLAPFMDEDSIERMVQIQAIKDAEREKEKKKGAAAPAAAAAAAAEPSIPILPQISPEAMAAAGPPSPRVRGASPAPASSSPYVYELTAILRHKGSSAFHGHYVADVRDPEDPSRWWHFDDDKCSVLKQFDDSNAAAVDDEGEGKKKKSGGGGGKKKKSSGGGSKKGKKAKPSSAAAAASGAEDLIETLSSDNEDEDEGSVYEGEAASNKKGSSKSKGTAAAADESGTESSSDVEEIVDEPKRSSSGTGDAHSPVVLDGADDSAAAVASGKKSSSSPAPLRLDNISSRSAYMVVYTLRSRSAAPRVDRGSFTSDMEAQIRESDQRLQERIREYAGKKMQLERLIAGRKEKAERVWSVAACEPVPTVKTPVDFRNALLPGTPAERAALTELAKVDLASAADRAIRDLHLAPSVFINGQWLEAWFSGQPMDEFGASSAGRGSSSGAKGDVIDLADEGGAAALSAEEQVALMESKEEAEKARLKAEAEQRELEAVLKSSEADARAMEADAVANGKKEDPSLMADVPSAHAIEVEKVEATAAVSSAMDDAAAAVAPPADTVSADSAGSAAAVSAASASVPPSTAPAAPAASAPLMLFHPLWPGDLAAAQAVLICKHGRPNPHNNDMRRISREAWNMLLQDNELQKKHLLEEYAARQGAAPSVDASTTAASSAVADGTSAAAMDISDSKAPDAAAVAGGDVVSLPELPCTALCELCSRELVAKDEEHEENHARRDALCSVIDARREDAVWQAGVSAVAEDAMYLAKGFLSKWRARAHAEMLQGKFTQRDRETDVNQAITCVHGGLGADEFEKKQRDIVPKHVWDEFLHFYPKSRAWRVGDKECDKCRKTVSDHESAARAWRVRYEQDKLALPNVARGLHPDYPGSKVPSLDSSWYLVGADWARSMKDHLMGKLEVVPRPLRNDQLLCKHGKLLFNPYPRVMPDKSFLRDTDFDAPGCVPGEIALVGELAWEQIKKSSFYCTNDEQAVPIEMRVHALSARSFDPSNWSSVRLSCNPPPCPECIHARLHSEKASRLAWEAGTVTINLLQEGAPVPGMASELAAAQAASAAAAAAASGSVVSVAAGRPRRGGGAGSTKPRGSLQMEPFQTDLISSKTELGLLKLSLSELIGIPPGQQDFFLGGRLLAPDSKTLEELEVPKSAELYVRRNPEGNEDFLVMAAAADASCASRRRNAGPEVGFAGTGLSSAPVPRKSPAPPAAAASAPSSSSSPARASPAPAAAAAAASSPPPPKPAGWTCKSCTFINEQADHLACEMCGSARA